MKKKLCFITIFLLSFLAGVLYFGEKYYRFGLSIENLILVFANPIGGTDKNVIRMLLWDTTTLIVIPSILLAIFIVFLPKILLHKYIKKCFEILLNFMQNALARNISFSLCISLCFLIIAINRADSKLNFIESINYKFFNKPPFSQFYEEHYVAPNIENFTAKNTRNLIVIFSESMESTYSGKNIHGGGGTTINILRTES